MSSPDTPPDDQTRIVPRPGGGGQPTEPPTDGSAPQGSTQDEATRIVARPRPGGNLNQAHGNHDRTQIRPRPRTQGGQSALPGQLQLPPPSCPKDTPPLLKTLWPVLSLVPELKRIEAGTDLTRLQSLIVELMDRVQRTLNVQVERQDLKKDASYVVCALIDETALNSDWGEKCHWAQTPLLSRFHQETYGGERVFEIIEKCLAQPRQYPELLELLYLCLSLGFMGQFRLDPDGQSKISQTRADIYNVLPEQRKQKNVPLSECIKPNTGLRQQLQSFMPAWIYTATLMLIAFGVFSYYSFALNSETDALRLRLANLVPTPEKALLPDGITRKEVLQLQEQLAAETRQGAVAINDYTTHTEIVLSGDALFASGSAQVAKAYHPILFKISKVLADIPGRIIVSGHTDDLAIRTPQFPSNWHLSLARAASVVAFLEQSAAFKAQLLPEGRGASTPINKNISQEQRAQNRRVVIEIYYGETS